MRTTPSRLSVIVLVSAALLFCTAGCEPGPSSVQTPAVVVKAAPSGAFAAYKKAASLPIVRVPLLSKAPKIDGDPTDDVWGEAFKTETFYRTTSRWVPDPAQG
ncbi:hypothetical protein LCGC14_2689010, partial [marine sediment metagenome]